MRFRKNYDFEELCDDLDKIGLTYIISQDECETHLYNVGRGKEFVNYEDQEFDDFREKAEMLKKLATVYENMESTDLEMTVSYIP